MDIKINRRVPKLYPELEPIQRAIHSQKLINAEHSNSIEFLKNEIETYKECITSHELELMKGLDMLIKLQDECH